MDLLESLKSEGWHLTEEGIAKIPENIDKSDLQNVRKWAMDMDFREIAGGALPQDISKKDESIPGKIILQITKIRNLSAPKSHEESYAGSPKFLQIELTDGVNQIIGLEMETLPDVSLSTPPGTKIFLTMEKIPLMQGWLMLSNKNMRVIGGKVPALIEKWELNRALQRCAKSGRMNTGSSGPPPWIAFGQKIQKNIPDDKNFKSLNASKDKENKTNNEFDAMRSEAIAEAAKTGKRKVFGGGQQQMVDHNVKKIMEKGYSEDQAKYALKATRNNLERALFNLKRRDEYKNKEEFNDKMIRGVKRIGKDSKKAKSEEVVASKPAGNVSLFDYLTDKLPVAETTNDKPAAPTKTERPPPKYNSYNDAPKAQSAPPPRSQSQPQSYQQNNGSNNINNASRPKFEKFENNISSSFANRNVNNGPSDHPYGLSQGQRDYNTNRNKPPRDGPGQYNSSNQYATSQRDSGDKYRGNTRNIKDRNQRMPERNSNYQNQTNYHTSNNYESQSRYNRNNNNNSNNPPRKNYENNGGSSSGPSRYQQREGNNMSNQSQSSKPYHENRTNSYGGNNEKINKLTESTAKMRIENAKTPPSGRNSHVSSMAISGGNLQQSHSHHQSHQQQHQGHQQHQQAQQILQPPQTALMPNNFNPLPNGFAYDPSKIMGFRSKEANEFAMSVLKNQTPAQIAQSVVTQPTHYPPPMQIPQQAYPPPAQFLMQPQHSQPPPPPAFAVNQFGDWVWKIGDRCLAKYWDDGRFYEAEITNLSENTCVVLFIEYGNHEEVLKTDCIPITDSQHRTINYSKMNEINNPHHHQTVRGVGGRYRGERQVYVPPPKREA